MKTMILAVLSMACSFALGATPGKMTWENLDEFACGNHRELKHPVEGIVIQHPWLNQKDANPSDEPLRKACTEANVLYVHTKADSRAWMNDGEVAFADEVLDVLIRHFAFPTNVPVVSCGWSMGAQGAIVFARYSRHHVVAAAANCPPCDLVYHYSERPDLPETFKHAFGDTPDLKKRLERYSPLHLVKELPDIDYYVVQTDADKAVSKTAHADRFAAAMKGRPRFTYAVVKDRKHCSLDPVGTANYCDFIVKAAKRSAAFADGFTFYCIEPFSPGTEKRLADEIVELKARTGIDLVLYSLSAAVLDLKLQSAAFNGLTGSKIWFVNGHKGDFPVPRRYTDVSPAARPWC